MQKNRLLGLDLARGLAILGMIIVNFKTSMAFGKEGPEWLVGLVGLLDGRAAACFVVLAGMGLSLLSQRARNAGDKRGLGRNRRLLFNRAIFLLITGLIFSLIWPADILHYYAIFIAIGTCLLTVTKRLLLFLAGIFTLVFSLLLSLLDYERGWDFTNLTYSGFWTLPGMLRNLFFNGFHPVFPWTAFLLFGMWLGRCNLLDPNLRRRLFLGGASLALVTEALSSWLVQQSASLLGTELASVLLGTSPMPPMPLYVLAGTGTAVSVICLSVHFSERWPDLFLARLLVPTGQLALTHYICHVVVGLGFLGLIGRLSDQSFVFSVQSALVYMLFTVLFSVFWRQHYLRGPLEMLMRRISDP